MPIEVVEPSALAPVVGPAVVRIGPDRTLLDAPWEIFGCTVANVWHDERAAGGWVRVQWPCEYWSHRSIVPLDLHAGHVLELSSRQYDLRAPFYAIVVDVDAHRMILVGVRHADSALAIHHGVVDAWRQAELLATAKLWWEKIAGRPPS